MPKSISEQLNETFNAASASYMRNLLKSDRDSAEFEVISQSAIEKQENLTRLYHEEYDARLNVARQILYDKAAQFKLNHPPPPGGGRYSAAAINREAHRQVQFAHEADLQQVRDDAQQAFEDLLDRAHRRNQTKGMAADAFLRASDRRSGVDRRVPKPSLD